MLNLGNMFEVNVLSYAKQLLDLQNKLINWVLFERISGVRTLNLIPLISECNCCHSESELEKIFLEWRSAI